jgi:glycosyltransferase involved in cell wall biosynthesis
MRIVIAIPCLLRGGTEAQTLNLVRVLTGEGWPTTLLCYFESDPLVVEEFRSAGAEVRLLGWARQRSALAVILGLVEELRALAPGVVHVQYMAPGLLPVLAARLARIPVILATVHQPGRTHGWKRRRLLRLGARLCTRFLCVSQAAERSWFGVSILIDPSRPASLSARHATIHNAIDLSRLDAALPRADRDALRRELNVPPDAPVVGAIARLAPEKGIDVLLEAFARLPDRRRASHLLVVGDGPERARLEALASELRVGDRCHWLGRQPWDQAISWLVAMDVVVVPSRFEGFGLSAAEAMAAGKPVVASDVDGLAEVLGPGVEEAGILVPSDDPEALAFELSRLLGNKDVRARLGRAARERVERHFSFETFRSQTLALYPHM